MGYWEQKEKDVKTQMKIIEHRKYKMDKFRTKKNLKNLKIFATMNESARLIHLAVLNYRSLGK